jgi:hypothetical protein
MFYFKPYSNSINQTIFQMETVVGTYPHTISYNGLTKQIYYTVTTSPAKIDTFILFSNISPFVW